MPKKKPTGKLPELSSLPKRLAYARGRIQVTKRSIAEAAGMDPSQLTRYEKGTGVQGIEAATLIKLARALQVPIGWLAADEGELGPTPVFREGRDRRFKTEAEPDSDKSTEQVALRADNDSEQPSPGK